MTTTGSGGSATTAGGAVIIVHCDPHIGPEAISNSTTAWQKLEALVAKSNDHGVVLSLLFAVPWAEHAVAEQSRVDQLVGWIGQGHQVGFHHHDATHAAQPSFANCGVAQADWDPAWSKKPWQLACKPKYDPTIGFQPVADLQEMLWKQLPKDTAADIVFGCHGTEVAMRTFEWRTSHIRFSQGNADGPTLSPVAGAKALARATCVSYGGLDMPELGSHPFVTVKPSGPSGDDVAAELNHADATSDDFAVVTFHAQEYEGTGQQQIDTLLEQVGQLGASRLATEVLEHISCP